MAFYQNLIPNSQPTLQQYVQLQQQIQMQQQHMQLQQLQIQQLQQQLQHKGHVQRQYVAVFGDLENCPIAISTHKTLSDLHNDFNTKIKSFLGNDFNKKLVSWTLYANTKISGYVPTKVADEAGVLGIDILHVESRYKPEAVDKRIICDIPTFIAKCGETLDIGHIVLISGDKDFGNVLAKVRNLKSTGKIIIFHDDAATDDALYHADKTFCMFKRYRDETFYGNNDESKQEFNATQRTSPPQPSSNNNNNKTIKSRPRGGKNRSRRKKIDSKK